LQSQGECKFIVLEAAVLYDAGWEKYTSEVWFICINRDTAKERLMARNSLSEEQAEVRLDKQVRNEEHSKKSQVVIDNTSMSPDELSAVVLSACQKLL
jgi:dephospho-CoA kinase